jgi:hypothetical protein
MAPLVPPFQAQQSLPHEGLNEYPLKLEEVAQALVGHAARILPGDEAPNMAGIRIRTTLRQT